MTVLPELLPYAIEMALRRLARGSQFFRSEFPRVLCSRRSRVFFFGTGMKFGQKWLSRMIVEQNPPSWTPFFSMMISRTAISIFHHLFRLVLSLVRNCWFLRLESTTSAILVPLATTKSWSSIGTVVSHTDSWGGTDFGFGFEKL